MGSGSSWTARRVPRSNASTLLYTTIGALTVVMEGVDLTCLYSRSLTPPLPATVTYSSSCFWFSEGGLHSHGWLSEQTSTMGVDTVWKLQSPVKSSEPHDWPILLEGVLWHSFGGRWIRQWANRAFHSAFLTPLGQFSGMYAESPRLGLSAAFKYSTQSCLFALLSLHTQQCFHQLPNSQTVLFSFCILFCIGFSFCILCII